MKATFVKTSFLIALCVVGSFLKSNAQAGITASPSRLYFSPENKPEQTIVVVNPSNEKNLEVGISLNDWKYDSLGNNIILPGGEAENTLSNYVKILPAAFFTLGPGETKNVSISLANVPENDNVPVRSAMLYLTQLNPGDATNQNGAAIKVTVRMGIKIYYTARSNGKTDLDITNFEVEKGKDTVKGLRLYFDNIGDLWANGTVKFDFLNKESGKKYSSPSTEFYTMPGDKRIFEAELPKGLVKGSYTVTGILSYGKNDELKLAEIDFDY